jgi:hypothetical protein
MYYLTSKPKASVLFERQAGITNNSKQIIKLILNDDENAKLSGSETITYFNNSPIHLNTYGGS